MSKNKSAKVLVFANEKGGVGKTTGAREVAGVLKKNKKILLIDADFQRNLTGSLIDEPQGTIYDVMTGKDIKDCIISVCDNVDLIPGDLALRHLDEDLRDTINTHSILKEQLEKIEKDYDYIIIDCRPAMGEIEKNALVCADFLIVPIEPHYFSLDGLDILQSYSEALRGLLRPSLKTVVYFNRVGQGNAPYDVMDTSKRDYDIILNSFIRENVKLKEASMNQKFITDYAPRSNGAVDFKGLVLELIRNGIR